MPRQAPPQSFRDLIVRGLRTWSLPRLIELPPSEWHKAIEQSQGIDFDFVEKILLLAGVVFVVYLLRVTPEQVGHLSLPVIYLVQFIEAVPLLILLVGPVYLRRARRGLDQVIEDRNGGSGAKS